MHQISHSALLQALGYAIVNSLWQVALLWIVVVLINGLVRTSSHNKYRVALFAQLAGFAWFALSFAFYYEKCREALSSAGKYNSQQVVDSVDINSLGAGINGWIYQLLLNTEHVLPYLSLAYLLLLVLLAARWVKGYHYTQNIQHRGLHKIDVEWRLFTTRIAEQLGIKTKVQVYLSELVNSPLTIGYFKPVILVPLASINHLTTEQMEAVLLHELAHIKRMDYLVNMLVSVTEILLFFNPFTQLISGVIRKERENSCDDWVLQFQYSASSYAQALLQIATLQAAPVFAMNAGGKKGGDLLQRVKRMLNKADKPFDYRKHLLALLLMTTILTGIAWYKPVDSKQQSLDTAKPKTQLVVQPMVASIENPFFNPVYLIAEPIQKEVTRVAKAKQQARNDVEEDKEDVVHFIPPVVVEKLKQVRIEQLDVVVQGPAMPLAPQAAAAPPAPFDITAIDSLSFYPRIVMDRMEMNLSGDFMIPAPPAWPELLHRWPEQKPVVLHRQQQRVAEARQRQEQQRERERRGYATARVDALKRLAKKVKLDSLQQFLIANAQSKLGSVDLEKLEASVYNYQFTPAIQLGIYDSILAPVFNKIRIDSSYSRRPHNRHRCNDEPSCTTTNRPKAAEEHQQPKQRKTIVVYDGKGKEAENISIIIEIGDTGE